MSTSITFSWISFKLLDGTTMQALEDREKNWNYYSKGWHRDHGPKVIVSNRRVEKIDLTGQVTVLATYNRWPNKVSKDAGMSGVFIAMLKILKPGEFVPLMGTDRNLDEAIKYMLSRGIKYT